MEEMLPKGSFIGFLLGGDQEDAQRKGGDIGLNKERENAISQNGFRRTGVCASGVLWATREHCKSDYYVYYIDGKFVTQNYLVKHKVDQILFNIFCT